MSAYRLGSGSTFHRRINTRQCLGSPSRELAFPARHSPGMAIPRRLNKTCRIKSTSSGHRDLRSFVHRTHAPSPARSSVETSEIPSLQGGDRWVFFDRGVVEALGMLHEASPLAPCELAAMLSASPFRHRCSSCPHGRQSKYGCRVRSHICRSRGRPRQGRGVVSIMRLLRFMRSHVFRRAMSKMSVGSWALITSDAFVGKPRPHERSRHPT